MKFDEEIQLAIEELESKGAKGPFKIVPIVNKRCLVPCVAGRCNCYPLIKKTFTLVTEESYKYALQDANSELNGLQKMVDAEYDRINKNT